MKQEQRNIDYRSLLEDGLFQLKKTQSRLKALEYAKTEPIAIVGIGCRFPGGIDNPAQLWRILRDGVDTITEVPKNRWDIDAYYRTLAKIFYGMIKSFTFLLIKYEILASY
jgi:hypothetical protein